MIKNAIKIIVLSFPQKLRVITLSFCFLFSIPTIAQINLIPNASFEDSIDVPQIPYELYKCQNWYPASNSPDYFSTYSPLSPTLNPSCGVSIPKNAVGYQSPKQGNFYAGGFMYVHSLSGPSAMTLNELIGVKLLQPLKKKYLYNFKLYYNVSDGSQVASNQLGAYFSVNQFSLTGNTYSNSLLPQVRLDTNTYMTDTMNWIPVRGKFFARGQEEYLTIGNFKDALHTKTISLNTNFPFSCAGGYVFCYTYIDSLSLYEIPVTAANCANDTLICLNDSVKLGANIIDTARYSWQPTLGLSCVNCANPKAKPLISTSYILTKKIYGTVTYDTINVIVVSPPIANAGTNTIICAGSSYSLGTDNSNYYNYLWKPPIALSCTNCALPIASPTSAISYTLTKSACGYSNSAMVSINIKPDFTLTPQIILKNTIACLTDTLKFSILNYPNSNDLTYNWQPQNMIISSSLINATSLIQNNSYYYFGVSNSTNGNFCPFNKKDSIYINIPDTCKIMKEPELFIPNGFSPNGDGKNETFLAKLPYTKTAKLFIYNRWGNLLYQTSTYGNNEIIEISWDGTYKGGPCVSSTYYYIIETEAKTGENKVYKGFVTLMR